MPLRPEKPEITAKNCLSSAPGEYPCGNNLHLIVTPSGGRRWAFRYQCNGVVKKMGFGSAKETGLKLSEAKEGNCGGWPRGLTRGSTATRKGVASKDHVCSAISPRNGGRLTRPA
jgi:hypothetical protein